LVDSIQVQVPEIKVTNADESFHSEDELEDIFRPKSPIGPIKTISTKTDTFEESLEVMSKEISDFELSKACAQKPEESPSTSSSSRRTKHTDYSDSEDSFAMSDDINKLHPNYKMSNYELTRRIRRIYLVKMKELADTSSRLLVTAARVSQREVFPLTSFNGFFPLEPIP
jgi:hypothetical protein